MLFHFFQVQKLRALLDLIRQLFFHIISQVIKLGLVPGLHISDQFLSLLVVLNGLFVPKVVESFQLLLMGP